MDNEQYLDEKALEKDTTRLGDVYRLHKKGLSRPKIMDKLKVKSIGAYSRAIEAIEKEKLPTSPTTAKSCRDILRSFIKHHNKDLSSEFIQKLQKLIIECGRRANNRQAVQRSTKSKKETSQAEEVLEKSDIAGIYVYNYPKYYHHPDVPETNDTDVGIRLKIGMSEKDVYKRVMQQRTGMPERPKFLQIWVAENDGDLREIEKKLHDHLRKAGHGDPSNEGREWFLTNEDSVESTANLLGLTCYFDHRKPKTDMISQHLYCALKLIV